MDKKRIGQRLKYIREKRNLRQNYVAQRIGIHNSTLNKYESGEREPDLETLNKLADIYNVSADFLMCRTDDPTPAHQREQEPNTAFYNLDGLTEEEKKYLDMQLEIFRKLKEEQKNKNR